MDQPLMERTARRVCGLLLVMPLFWPLSSLAETPLSTSESYSSAASMPSRLSRHGVPDIVNEPQVVRRVLARDPLCGQRSVLADWFGSDYATGLFGSSVDNDVASVRLAGNEARVTIPTLTGGHGVRVMCGKGSRELKRESFRVGNLREIGVDSHGATILNALEENDEVARIVRLELPPLSSWRSETPLPQTKTDISDALALSRSGVVTVLASRVEGRVGTQIREVQTRLRTDSASTELLQMHYLNGELGGWFAWTLPR